MRKTKYQIHLEEISKRAELNRSGVDIILDDNVSTMPLDNVNSHGFISRDFDDLYAEEAIDYTVRGVH